MRSITLCAMFWMLLILGAQSVSGANSGVISIDRIGCRFNGDSIYAGQDAKFVIRFLNNTGERVSVSSGFVVYSPDGAPLSSITIDSLYSERIHKSWFSEYFDLFSLNIFSDGQPADTVGVLGDALLDQGRGLPIGYNDTPFVITVHLDGTPAMQHGKHICLDSAAFGNGVGPLSPWKWTGRSGDYTPEFKGYFTGLSYSTCFTLYQSSCIQGSAQAASQPEGCYTCPCCVGGMTGNVNGHGIVDLSDLSVLITYLNEAVKPTIPCMAEANINNLGIVDLSDLSLLISYLTASPRPELPTCTH